MNDLNSLFFSCIASKIHNTQVESCKGRRHLYALRNGFNGMLVKAGARAGGEAGSVCGSSPKSGRFNARLEVELRAAPVAALHVVPRRMYF